ncbi:MAG: hypothetical protein GF349_05030 [Candidatus Magasanikbacteria bacterium]|nr:hypothetical protein [Candidatus Magasanikbacteria bacterium]
MEKLENTANPESKMEKAHWEHFCKSCKLEGSTSFTEQGKTQKMDVYSCSDHVQPGIHGTRESNLPGDRVIVRYANSTNSTIGEVSFDKTQLDMENLRSRARNRRGKSDLPPAQIAIGKIL